MRTSVVAATRASSRSAGVGGAGVGNTASFAGADRIACFAAGSARGALAACANTFGPGGRMRELCIGRSAPGAGCSVAIFDAGATRRRGQTKIPTLMISTAATVAPSCQRNHTARFARRSRTPASTRCSRPERGSGL